MPPKKGVGGGYHNSRSQETSNQSQPLSSTNLSTQVKKNPIGLSTNQSKLSIAPLIIEGVKLNKLQLNDILKEHLKDIKILDVQLSRAGIFTLYAGDVNSFNRLLNEFTAVLVAKGQAAAKIYVPRSIQRIKDTEMVAFVKKVDLEIPDDRITAALKEVGLNVESVVRLTFKDRSTPTRTIKVTFSDYQNRNAFIHVGLQVDSMHFPAEAATQNTKPVQCFVCMKYNHVAKYCRTNQQVCSRCGDNHRFEACTNSLEKPKCFNCKGEHLATSPDCPDHKEQVKKMQKLVNQYTSTTKPISATAPNLLNLNDFPSLPNNPQRLQDGIIDELVNVLTSKMEKIIEETTNRIFKTLHQKIKKLEKTISKFENMIQRDDDDSDSESDSDEEIKVIKEQTITTQQQQSSTAATAAETTKKQNNNKKSTTATATTTSCDVSKKPPIKSKPRSKSAAKRIYSPDSSLDSTAMNNKDLKPNDEND